MRPRTVILLLLAVMIAGGTAMLARNYLATQRTQAITEATPLALQAPARSVLVARADTRRGQILRTEDMVWQIWPEGALDKNYVVLGVGTVRRMPESFAGWVVRNPIAGGEPITESKIIQPGNRGFLAAVLRPGMVAISVPVTVTTGISGFIFPGDLVNMLLTYVIPPPAVAKSPGRLGETAVSTYAHKAAETVLHNVRVIGIDQRLESKLGEAVVAHQVTFEVTPKQSEVITLAGKIVELSLTLRSLVPGPEEEANAATSAEPASAMLAGGERATAATPIGAQYAAAASDQRAVPATPAAPSGGPRVIAPSSPGKDNSIAKKATYTLDSEISALLPQPKVDTEATPEPPDLWVCRGPALACRKLNPSESDGDRFLAAYQLTRSVQTSASPGRE